jgi:hypothetical protein
MRRAHLSLACAIGLAFAATGAGDSDGAVIQSTGAPVQNRATPLHLSDAQRARIREVAGVQDTDVSFALKATRPASKFSAETGKKMPKGVKGHSLPPPLIYEMPALKQYKYVKFKDQLWIVNPMNRKIVDIIPLVQS